MKRKVLNLDKKKIQLGERKNRLKDKAVKLYLTVHTFLVSFIIGVNIVYAETGTGSIDNFINFACDWLKKIGGVVALVGGVQFALGWQREDSEGKSRGLFTLMAGFMLIGIAQSKGLFGL